MNDHFQHAYTFVAAEQVRLWLDGPEEIAFFDVREEGQFGWGHPLLAGNLPYSRLEAEIGTLVPRRATRVVLLDDGGTVALKSARRLAALGYTRLHILDGGVDAWTRAGFKLFEGVHVPSKSFAEVVEHAYETPSITAEELKSLLDGKADVALLDSRTEDEFARFHVPGAVSVPGGELVYRFADVVPSQETLVVVSCAGRTRGIMGAQSLINAGVPNRVVALAGGTQAWRLASLELESGPRFSAAPSAAARAFASSRASELATRFAIERIDHERLAEWRADATRTTYVLDVRSPAEYEHGHLPDTVLIPGGQLIQTLDLWVAVRHARIVLVDDDGVRATVTAHWLKQLGWNVSVLADAFDGRSLESGPDRTRRSLLPEVGSVDAQSARSWLGDAGRIVSVSPSGAFRDGHPAGAVWSIRPRLDTLPDDVANAPRILIVAQDYSATILAVSDLAEIVPGEVRALLGGDKAWRAQGLDWESSPEVPADDARIDFLTWNYDRHLGNAAASRAYLQWEQELPRQIEEDGSAQFQVSH